jgi:predicted dehydrogenase
VSPVRLGIIATGLATAKLHWPALRQLTHRFRVTAFANHTRPKAEAFAQLSDLSMDNYHADYNDLLQRQDVDAVLITLPIPLLYPATRAALEAGKHVLCEKPAGGNIEQGRDFLQLATQYPLLKVLIGENFFYRDDLRLARTLIDSGILGRVHMLTYHVVGEVVPREGNYAATRWRQAPRYRGGYHLDGGVHHVAQMRMLCGDIDQLHGLLQHANPDAGGPSDLVLNLHFVNQAVGSYTAGYLPLIAEEPNAMRVYGEDGIMVLTGRTFRVYSRGHEMHEYAFQTDGGYYNQLLNFADAIENDEPIVGTIAQSFVNLLVVMQAMDSAESQRLVSVSGAPDALSDHPIPIWRPRGASGLFDGLPCVLSESTRDAPP